MRKSLVLLIKLFKRIFFRKKIRPPAAVNLFPKTIPEVLIPNQSHYPSLGIHRIRDTPVFRK